jgi:hypothetical protein
MRKPWDRLAAGGALLGAGVLVVYLMRPSPPPPVPGVTWDNVGRIQPGMTQTEVQAVLGRPPDWEGRWAVPAPHAGPEGTATTQLWEGSPNIAVHSDGGGRVLGLSAIGAPPPTWVDRVKERLGL